MSKAKDRKPDPRIERLLQLILEARRTRRSTVPAKTRIRTHKCHPPCLQEVVGP